MDTQDVPLHALFERAWSIHEDADDQQAEDAIRWLQAAVAKASAVGIFSSNEEVDDIATADLKYLLLPYLQGYLLSETHERDTHKRLASLEEATHHLMRFLEDIRQYKVLSQEQEATLGAAALPGGQLDAATKRAQKIKRFQLEKAVKAELDALKMKDLRSKRLRQIQQEEDDAEEPQAGDEDAERESWLKQIALASLKAADRLSSIHQEVEVLKHAASLSEDARSQPAPNQAMPPDLMASLQRAHAALSANSAERMRAEVFRPSHVLPTMTLAEQAEKEMAAAQRASEAQSRAEAAKAAAKAADKDGEQETLRQRAWDDWKDDNPRGAGNSKLLPTA